MARTTRLKRWRHELQAMMSLSVDFEYPFMSPSEHEDLVTILETSDISLLAVIKSILLGAEIPFLVQGDEALSLLPMVNIGGPFSRRGMGVAIMVAKEDVEVASELISEVSEST